MPTERSAADVPTSAVPPLLYHYYDRAVGPFVSLSDLCPAEARAVQGRITAAGTGFASRRSSDYVDIRFELEDRLREGFVARGGKPERVRPHYLTLGACEWLLEWYENPSVTKVGLQTIPRDQVSFTYGDLFPAFRWRGAEEPPAGAGPGTGAANPTRGGVFLVDELPDLIARYGLPQRVNPVGEHGPLRYIEAQLWADGPIEALR